MSGAPEGPGGTRRGPVLIDLGGRAPRAPAPSPAAGTGPEPGRAPRPPAPEPHLKPDPEPNPAADAHEAPRSAAPQGSGIAPAPPGGPRPAGPREDPLRAGPRGPEPLRLTGPIGGGRASAGASGIGLGLSSGPARPRASGPVTIEDLPPAPSPADAPPIGDEPDAPDAPRGEAMRALAALTARPPSRLGAWALSLAGALVAFAAAIALWEFVAGLLARNAALGAVALALALALAGVLLAIALREGAAFARLARLDELHREAGAAHATGDLAGARAVAERLARLYADRPALALARGEVEARARDVMDAADLLRLAELRLLAPLDAAASREIEAAARQVAAVTAMVPLALADLAAALASNLRMIRRIAEIYGGRSGRLGTMRLTRAVFAHLVATGAVAVGEDLIGTVAGGSLLKRVSRRFGEGVVNGALTARVGVAAMEVCRPMPFRAARRPSVTAILQRALTGVFNRA